MPAQQVLFVLVCPCVDSGWFMIHHVMLATYSCGTNLVSALAKLQSSLISQASLRNTDGIHLRMGLIIGVWH